MNAKLRSLTYSRGDIFDRTIDIDLLQRDCPLDQLSSKTLSKSSAGDATASLGHFDNIPLETMHNVLSNLDLAILTTLRSVSRRMNVIVDSLLPYSEILTHAPNALRALLSTGAARYFTPMDVRTALRAQDCFLCNNFGAFLYLPECRRCCWQCLTASQDLMPVSKSAAQSLFSLDEATMADMPTLLHIPGSYGPKQRRRPNVMTTGEIRVPLVAYGAATKAAAAANYQASAEDYEDYEKATLETRIALRGPLDQDRMRDMDCQNYDPVGYREGYGLEPQRFMAAVRFPTLLAGRIDEAEWGLSCLGCLEGAEEGEEEAVWNEQFSSVGMLAHLGTCVKARQAWVDDRVKEVRDRGRGKAIPLR